MPLVIQVPMFRAPYTGFSPSGREKWCGRRHRWRKRGKRRRNTGMMIPLFAFTHVPSLSHPLVLQVINSPLSLATQPSNHLSRSFQLFSNCCSLSLLLQPLSYPLGPGSYHILPGNCHHSPKWPSGLQKCALPVTGGVSWRCSLAKTVNGPLLFWDNIYTLFFVLQGTARSGSCWLL